MIKTFNKNADIIDDTTEISGRYFFQKNDEKRAINECINKLQLKATDNILDIGCGVGNMSIPISFLVKSVTCIDCENLVNIINNKKIKNINCIPGNFLNIELNSKFDKILIYSVLHYLKKEELYLFIDKCLNLLNPNGIILFGDIPNSDKKERFLKKYQTQEEREKWNKLMNTRKNVNIWTSDIEMTSDIEIFDLNDDTILNLVKYIRNKNFNCFLIEQSQNLPFNKTREDIIVMNYA